ncbi:MAG: hypothetical protein IJF84_00290 [Thermoguttaceae bacterium]|nr:hypothetical protein [Thermoguttaceae bacterium]
MYSVEGTTVIEARSFEEAERIAKDQFIDGTIGDELGENKYDFDILLVEEDENEKV